MTPLHHVTCRGRLSRGRLSIVVGVCAAATSVAPLHAQERLFPARTATIGPVFEHWSFASGLLQPVGDGSGVVELKSASAWSLPLAASIAFGDRWTFDLSTAVSNGTVRLRAADPSLGKSEYSLSGFTDVKARLTARVVGDNVIATVGANLPSGATSLDPEEFAALRVLAAPALAMQTPALGTGPGATAGLVLARRIASWAWAFGASYELRRTYTPVAFATGTPGQNVDPGDALHLSVGADGLLGQHGMTLALTTDVFTKDQLDANVRGGTGGTVLAPDAFTTRLGPIVTIDGQLRLAAPRFRELTVYAVDRYRAPYERAGRRVDNSNANYLDAGVRAVFPMSPSTGVLSVLNLRHQTGLKSDSTLATAATAGAGVTLGLIRAVGDGYSVQPFVRVDYAKIKSANTSAGATGQAVGVTLGRRF
jgi:hypothetical protein